MKHFAFCVLHFALLICACNIIIINTIIFRKTIDKHPLILYYVINHKVGAVGALCPQAKNSGFPLWRLRHISNLAKQRIDRKNNFLRLDWSFAEDAGKPVP